MAAATSADAQGFAGTFFDDDILPPRVIAWRLSDRGFSEVSRPRFDGRVYVVSAVGPAGIPERLILDPATGSIINRRRLAGSDAYARLEHPTARPMPGYGWTEEDASPIPPPEPVPLTRTPRRPVREAARPADANPLGLNPDGGHRQEPPRRIARTSPSGGSEKTLGRVSPISPAPRTVPEAAKTDPAPPPTPTTPTPETSPPAGTVATTAADPKPVRQAAKPEWKDPPAEGKRPVRVIGGATVVPGKDGEAAQP